MPDKLESLRGGDMGGGWSLVLLGSDQSVQLHQKGHDANTCLWADLHT